MTVLTAVDFSDTSRSALSTAARLARRNGDSLHVLHCLEPNDGFSWGDIFESSDEQSEFEHSASDRLESFVADNLPDEARPSDVETHLLDGDAGSSISGRADELGADLTVVGATGQGPVSEYLFGSTAEEVVRRNDSPVLVVPPETSAEPFDDVVAPVDLSPCSEASLRHAADMARADAASLHALHAYLPPTQNPTMMTPTLRPERVELLEQKQQDRFEKFVDEADVAGLDYDTHFALGLPADVIDDAVDQFDADLVVMGTHGRRGFEKFFLGSTAARVLRGMPCPVMTVRGRD